MNEMNYILDKEGKLAIITIPVCENKQKIRRGRDVGDHRSYYLIIRTMNLFRSGPFTCDGAILFYYTNCAFGKDKGLFVEGHDPD